MKVRTAFSVIGLVLASVAIAAGTPIRGSSRNGVDSGAPTWLLFARTAPYALISGTKSVTMTREVVCPGQDVEATLSIPTLNRSGSCDSGQYLFIYQLTSTSTNVHVLIGKLLNFVADSSLPNYGVMVCDNSDPTNGNTLELCTNDPTGSHVPDITTTVSSTESLVTFTVPNFPTFKAGTPQQGKGLTLFVLTQQSNAVPIHYPTILIQ